ncbi:MAG: tRNA uridine-5-carboxymethylaminomethyl(34) synthesis GTPase MnmE [Deltaproteobacteria bacterium]|nr:MAG: tRNA uridine-5-carboxymethylaminomethyl(34) synthesis GTPase MnmE [Deltaproteobacteria bacterium]
MPGPFRNAARRAMAGPTMAILSGPEHSDADTIVAPATAPGAAAISIVRLSGPRTAAVLEALSGLPDSRWVARRLMRVALNNAAGAPLDDAMVVRLRAPHSYTGQQMAELHLHGSPQVVQSALEACQLAGARLARPGEFTYRAWLLGKLDLAQAEAVADLLAARGAAEVQAATRLVRGELSESVGRILGTLEALLAGWRAALDFPDYDTGEGVAASDLEVLAQCAAQLARLSEGCAERGAGGLSVALCGAPNAGKSSLLNALAGDERVLVDASPGTTRDPVEVQIVVQGHRLRLVDTAGLRRSDDALERRGMALSRRQAQRADTVLWLLAADAPSFAPPELPVDAVIISKSDLLTETQRQQLLAEAQRRKLPCLGETCAHDASSVVRLTGRLMAHLQLHDGNDKDARLLVRQRHLTALRSAHEQLQTARQAFGAHGAQDLLALDVERAAAKLGHILGRDVDAALLSEIFSRFCIGK